MPCDSTRSIELFHTLFNALLKAFQHRLPSGVGPCIAVRREAFLRSGGFDTSLKFDDVELVHRLARYSRFGIVDQRVFVSDRRYREEGVLRPVL